MTRYISGCKTQKKTAKFLEPYNVRHGMLTHHKDILGYPSGLQEISHRLLCRDFFEQAALTFPHIYISTKWFSKGQNGGRIGALVFIGH
jgi:hypothetical protein